MAKYVTYEDLKPRWGIGYSRMHIDRLVRERRFPPPIRFQPGGRKHWTDEQIDAHQVQMRAEAEAGAEAERDRSAA